MSGVKGQKKCPEPCPPPQQQQTQETCIIEPVCPEPQCPPPQVCQQVPLCPEPVCPPPQVKCEPTPQCQQQQNTNKGVKK